MSGDLFAQLDEEKRQRLRERGWKEAVGLLLGRPMWRNPDGNLFDETEAFAQLEHLERKEKVNED